MVAGALSFAPPALAAVVGGGTPACVNDAPVDGSTVLVLSYTGEEQAVEIPAGVTQVRIDACGAQGGSDADGAAGGPGGQVGATLAINGPTTLTVLVGQAGIFDGGPTVGGGGRNGGGSGGPAGSGGGGSFVFDDADAPLLIAGGGGGASRCAEPGGAGGGLDGASGALGTGFCPLALVGAGGGSQTTGGVGGQSDAYGNGSPGALSQGGAGGEYGGGGGGGWYGGGGGVPGSGAGGGSGYITELYTPSNTTNIPGGRAGAGAVRISYVTPASMTTQASPATTVGEEIADVATLTGLLDRDGGAPAGGSITFSLYGPDDTTCANEFPLASTIAVDGNGEYTSNPFPTLAAGTYRFIAAYSGDTANEPITGECNDENESVEVSKATPTLSTLATETARVGGRISDEALLRGVFLPDGATEAGTLTFNLYGPRPSREESPPNCEGDAVFTSAALPVTSERSYGSGSYEPEEAGTYYWVASYSGDDNNEAVSGTCGEDGETSVVSAADVPKTTPTLSTQATATARTGQPISDVATLTGVSYPGGEASPAGTVTFTLYGPSAEPVCNEDTLVFTSAAIPVEDGTTTYNSGPYPAQTAGTYYWVATYSGNELNEAVAGTCGEAGETSTVTRRTGGGGGGGTGGGVSPTPSVTPSASGSPSPTLGPTVPTSPQPGTTAPTTTSPTSAAPGSPPASPLAPPCPTVRLVVNTPTINAMGRAAVTVTGATPGATIELQGYSQNHAGTQNFDNDLTPVDRRAVADSTGRVIVDDLRPPSNTRVRARQVDCAYSTSAVINVRATQSMTVTRIAPFTYTFFGRSMPARPGGLIVSLYRIVGRPCSAGVESRDCPGEVLVGQDRALEGNIDGVVDGADAGTYAITKVFTADPPFTRANFVVKTGQDAQNAPGRSNTRTVLIF